MVVVRQPQDHHTRFPGVRIAVLLWIALAFFLGLSIDNQSSDVVYKQGTTMIFANINSATSTTPTIESSAPSKLPLIEPETLATSNADPVTETSKATTATTYHSGFKSTTTTTEIETTDAAGLGTRIAYLSQGQAKSYPVWKERFDAISENKNAVFLYHSFDEDCEGCLYQAGTTVSEGRNLVLSAAANSTNMDWNTYKYVVMFDDDILLLNSSSSTNRKFSGAKISTSTELDVIAAWKSFHTMLLDPNTTHPLIKPKCETYDGNDFYTSYQSCPDDNILAMRRDYVDWIYPYSTIGKQNFWVNIVALWKRMERCYPAGFLVDHRWTVANPQHRYKINKFQYKNKQWAPTKVLEVLNRDYPNLGQQAWKVDANTMYNHRCTVKQEPSFGIHRECKRVSEVRFQRWLAGDYEP
jgi:hypothetical protein